MQILQIICLVETIFGLIPSVFIVTSNIQCWMKGEILNSTDHIVTALGFSTVIYSVINIAIIVFYLSFPEMLLVTYLIQTVNCIAVYAFFSGGWLTTCLCFFFFMKMNNFKPGFFSWIKMKIDSLVPHLILAIEGLSICLSICLSVVYTIMYPKVKAVNSTSPSVTNYNPSTNPFSLGILIVSFCFSSLISIFTTGHIIVSLYKHTHRMRRNMGDGDGPSLKVHKRAACTLSSLFILYIINYPLTMAAISSNDTLYWIYGIFIDSFVFLQSIILILGNSRLLQKCVNILNKCRQYICRNDGHVKTVSS
ncbi:hypothetical protein GDO86_017624 [Hymenochirus boettgeri]|uniref:Taste receptor type 2 n=1 Tax=Hymenochirus boettgeri TaxID=247094 RepID=A0A8T2IKD8_9PIPI|nr:hypothetical protein GDO86_017624 [Hymenochirus boettgeri]